MKVYLADDIWPVEFERSVALGTFDGVHLGHQALIRALLADAEESGRVPSVFTFSDHPDLVFRDRETFPGLTMTIEEKVKILAGLGVAEVFLFPLAPQIYRLSATEFLRDLLQSSLNAGMIVVGEDARFGSGRSGDTEFLCGWGRENGVKTVIIEDLYFEGEKISSTRIRSLLQKGRLRQAAELLGRSFGFRAEVQSPIGVENAKGQLEIELRYPAGIVVLPPGKYQVEVFPDSVGFERRAELPLLWQTELEMAVTGDGPRLKLSVPQGVQPENSALYLNFADSQ